MSTIRDNALLLFVAIVVVNVLLAVAADLQDPPQDLFSNRNWWETVARSALSGLGAGITSGVGVVAAALGVEIRQERRRRANADAPAADAVD